MKAVPERYCKLGRWRNRYDRKISVQRTRKDVLIKHITVNNLHDNKLSRHSDEMNNTSGFVMHSTVQSVLTMTQKNHLHGTFMQKVFNVQNEQLNVRLLSDLGLF